MIMYCWLHQYLDYFKWFDTITFVLKLVQTNCVWMVQPCYRLQTKLRKGYVFTPVCHSVHRGVSAPVHAGIHSPQKQTTPPGSRHAIHSGKLTPQEADTTPGSKHPPGSRHHHWEADTPLWELDTPKKQTPPGKQTPPACHGKQTTTPKQMATAADGTHPTGMHSGLNCAETTVKRDGICSGYSD